jgi:putative peptide zinc metalloprotease protein
VIGVIGWALFVLPLPFATVVEGVIWIPDEALVRIGSGGFLELIACSTGQAVRQGDLLLQCRDPFLEADGLIVVAQIRELQARYDQEILADRVQARMTQEELHNLLSEQERIQERLRDLHVYSPSDGRVFIPGEVDLPGRFFQQGDLIGYVLGGFEPIVRVVVAQTEVDLVRNQCESIQLRLVDEPGMVYAAVIRREIPGAVGQLPSTTLGRSGGGEIPIDPMDEEGLRTLEPFFQFDLLIHGTVPDLYFGSRVYVRFSHGRMPLGFQVYRQIRQLFMKRFNV